LTETRAYQFGDDPMSIDSIRSLQNAMKHTDPADRIVMTEDDLEVFETEHNSSCATVVMIDISHSMILYGEDRITPAKKVALALTELIMTKYPKDAIDVLLFGDDAKEVPISEIPYAEVGPYHTNTKAGLELAQRILRRRKHNNKQIFMITDGKPSALNEGGRLYTNSFGLDMKIVNRTLEEADRCRRAGIPITTFMLATDPMLVNFVEQLSKINRGRAFYSSSPPPLSAPGRRIARCCRSPGSGRRRSMTPAFMARGRSSPSWIRDWTGRAATSPRRTARIRHTTPARRRAGWPGRTSTC